MAEGNGNLSGSHCMRRSSKRLRSLTRMRQLNSLPSYFDAKRKNDVFDALEVIETDLLLGKHIHPKVFLRLIRAMRVNLETAPDCFVFAMELLNVFERYQCKDVNVISDFFLFLLDATTWSYKRFEKDRCSEKIKPFYAPYGEENELEMVWSAARCRNWNILKLQLKYGMTMMIPSGGVDYCFTYMKWTVRIWNIHTAFEGVEYELLEEKFRCDFNPQSRKRMWLILRMLLLAETNLRFESESLTECYSLIFDSIPEAYLTAVEVKAFLERYIPAAYFGLIHKITESFKLLPEATAVPQPRSLQHLCRVQVRDSLRQNLNLPHGVSSLPLPTNLKKYITLHDDGIYNFLTTTKKKYCWRSETLFPETVLWNTENIDGGDDCIVKFIKYLS